MTNIAHSENGQRGEELRLLVFGINYAPEPTGIGPYTTDMTEWLARRGHEVDVITGLPHYPSWRIDAAYATKGFHKEVRAGVRVLRTPLRVPNGQAPSAYDRIRLETSFSLASSRYWWPRLLDRRRYDAVLAICPPLQMGVYPLLYARLRRVPWVFHVQDLQVDAAFRLGLLRRSLASRALYAVENQLLRRATCVSTISEAMRRRLIEKGVSPEKTWLLPNWADLEHIIPLPHQNAFRAELGVSDNEIVCMYSGTMGEKQGLETVIEAARLLESEQQIHFVFVGDGSRRKALEQAVAGLRNVSFLPVQPKARLNEVLAAADVHLVVQRRDAADLVMPSKLGNILAAGRPVLATADPGTA
ncbi:MAG: WcaI family glycosyltransferase, partial [Alicyclobacillus sp.]|nr:WcaI family glycosyltransferase [Alicyclobacillus sp.]